MWWMDSRGRFPFWSLKSMGWALILLGSSSLLLGIADTAYTAVKFEGDDCEDDYNSASGWTNNPCGHDDHVFAYVSAAIWGSLLIIITGVVGAMFSKWKTKNLRFHRDLFAVLAGMTAVLFIPVIIAMHALELKFANDMGVFYYSNDELKTRDATKFALPVVILILAAIEWIVCIIVFTVCCCCAPVSQYDEDSVYRSYREFAPRGRSNWWTGGYWPFGYPARPWVYDNPPIKSVPSYTTYPMPAPQVTALPAPQPMIAAPQPLPVTYETLPNYNIYATPVTYTY